MKTKDILVTGGAGYIGSHTIVELVNFGYTPIILDNLCNTSIDNIHGIEKITGKKIKFYEIDCTNKNDVNNIFKKEQNIGGVIHFAAYKSVEESVKNPEKYFKNNIGSLEVLLENMIQYNVNKIIFSSSCTVYGMPDKLPVKENAPFKKASSPYGETKQICENLLKKYKVNHISLRYFNPIGSHESSLIGDCSPDKPNNLIPIIAETAIGKRKKIIINGSDYKTSDGTCVRDYIHVVDLAIAHVKAINYLYKKKGKYAFNIGTGSGTSVLEAIKEFEKSNNITINYSFGPRREGDIEEIFADTCLAKNELEWLAKKSLEDGMISSWQWEKNK